MNTITRFDRECKTGCARCQHGWPLSRCADALPLASAITLSISSPKFAYGE
jgi:hypothetical protein